MENKQARKMRNFLKLKRQRMLASYRKLAQRKADKIATAIERSNRTGFGKLLHFGIIEAIQSRIAYNKSLNQRDTTTNEKTIANKVLRKHRNYVGMDKQNKRRKALRQNPHLLRSKKYKKYCK